MAVATARTPGFTTFRGRTTCDCVAAWLPVYERLLIQHGVIRSSLDLYQLTSNGAGASAGTHDQGGAFDQVQRDRDALFFAEEMGAAIWARTGPGWDPDHAHGVLNGCPHNGPARYQVEARKVGFDGLGLGGRAGRDPRGPIRLKTWRQGIAWAETQLLTPLQTAFSPWWPAAFNF